MSDRVISRASASFETTLSYRHPAVVQVFGFVPRTETTDFHRRILGHEHRPSGYALVCMLPSGDGDVMNHCAVSQ